MSACVIIEFIKSVGENRSNVRLAEHFIAFFATSLINSITQVQECSILFTIRG